MPFTVPPAPTSLLDAMAPGQSGPLSQRKLTASRPAPLDAAFLRRVRVWMLYAGVVGTFVVYSVWASPMIALSFAVGAGVSTLLLYTQEWFVRRVVEAKAAARRGEVVTKGGLSRVPLALLLPMKWLPVAALIGYGLKSGMLNAMSFAAGCTLLQVVIFSLAIGRLIAAGQKPLREVYVDAPRRSLKHSKS